MIHTIRELSTEQVLVAGGMARAYGHEPDGITSDALIGPRIEGDAVVYATPDVFWAVSPLGSVQIKIGRDGEWVLEAVLIRGDGGFLPDASSVSVCRGVSMRTSAWGSCLMLYFERELIALWQALTTAFVADIMATKQVFVWQQAVALANAMVLPLRAAALPDPVFADAPLPCSYALVSAGCESYYRVMGHDMQDTARTPLLRVAVHAVLSMRQNAQETSQQAVDAAMIAGTYLPRL